MQKVSVILPTFNESLIDSLLEKLTSHLERLAQYQFEVIVIDDSTDDTFEKIKRFAKKKSVPVRAISGNRKGKGNAIKKAVPECSGEIIFYMDADLTVSLSNIEKFIEILNTTKTDGVIGERLANREIKNLFSNPKRFILSSGLLWIQRALIFQSTKFADTQCGFKAFRAETLKKIAKKQRINGGMYDIEYLYIAGKNGLKISTVPVEPLPEVRASTINLKKCIIYDPLDLLSTKLRGIRGEYRIQET